MSNNEMNQTEELLEQETLVDAPWVHQFEEDNDNTTRSSRHHVQESGTNLYTKIIFVAIIAAIVLVVGWVVLRSMNIVGGNSAQNATTPPVPRLVLQSQTVSSSASDESSKSSNAESNTISNEVSSSNTETSSSGTPTETMPNTANGSTYTIKAGDSAYAIAQQFGMTVAQFYALNNLTANSVLLPGQTVHVSSSNTANATTGSNSNTSRNVTNNSARSYTIQAGDSLSTIAARHGMTLAELKQLNGFHDNSLLLPGQVIKVR